MKTLYWITYYMCATGDIANSCLAALLHNKVQIFDFSNSLMEQTLPGAGKTLLYSTFLEVNWRGRGNRVKQNSFYTMSSQGPHV